MQHDPELEAFKADLLEAVRDMKAGRAARETQVALSPVAEARVRTALSQAQFAQLLGLSAPLFPFLQRAHRHPQQLGKLRL